MSATLPDRSFARLDAGSVVLRRFHDSDLAAFLAYRRDPAVARYQSWEPDVADADGRRFLDEMARLHPGIPGEWFQFAVADRDTDELLGDCALLLDRDDPRQGEVGYSLAVAHQGQGHATRALTALLDYCFTTLALHRVRASMDDRNTPSARLLERVGLRREAHCIASAWSKGEWTSELGYAVLGREWRHRGDR